MFLNRWWNKIASESKNSKRPVKAVKSRRRRFFTPRLTLLEDRTLMSVTVTQNFSDINFQDSGGFTPPDTMMAVGPSAVVGAVNTAITLKSKTGTVLVAPEQFSTFFSSISTARDSFTDPQVMYDDQAGRFYVEIIEGHPNFDGTATMDFAYSTNANPTDLSAANWKSFQISTVNEGGTEFPDFPKMGWNNDAVFVSFNSFNAITNNFDHNLVMAISKASIAAGGALSTFQAVVPAAITGAGLDFNILIPARMHNQSTGNLEYFAQAQDTGGTNTTVNVVSETGYLTPTPTLTPTAITVNAYQNSPGVRDLTNQIDDRMLSADWINNQMVAAQDVGLTDGLNHARWYLFSTSGTPSLLQQGDIVNTGFDSSYPSIALNASGAIAMTYIQSSSRTGSTFPSMFVTGRVSADPVNTMETPVLVIAGKGHLGGRGGRGGDYSATEFDPTDPNSFWSANEFAFDNTGNNFDWGTQIADFSLVSGPVQITGSTITPTEGQSFSGPVATFSDSDTTDTTADFIASIDWGDGTSSAGTVSGSNGNFTISGAHTYADEGSATVTVTLLDDDSSANDATAIGTANVAEGDSLTGTGGTITATEGQSFSGPVATFSDTDGANVSGDFMASINWGDGTSSAGALSGSNGSFTVSGTHTYADEGSDTITVTLADDSAGTARGTTSGSANVAEGDSLTGTGSTITATEGQSFSGPVATFSDTYLANSFGDFTASIDWGDSAPTAGTVSGSHGSFTVSGTHTYTDSGAKNVTVTVSEDAVGAATAVAQSTANISGDVVINGTLTNNFLILMESPGGMPGVGNLTYILGGQSVPLSNVHSFSFIGIGSSQMKIDYVHGSPLAVGGIFFVGGAAANELDVDLSTTTTPDTVTITSNGVSTTTASQGLLISYSAAAGGGFGNGVNVSTGSAADFVNVQSTLVGGTTFVSTGAGNNVVVVSSKPDATGVLTGLAGPLSIDGGAGMNQLWVSELGSATGDEVILTSSQISSPVLPFTINYQATGGTFGNGVILVTGSGADYVNVQSTLAGGTTYVFTEGGNDVIVVSSTINATGALNGLAGPLNLDAGAGSNQLWVSELGSAIGDEVILTSSQIFSPVLPFTVNYQATGGTFGNGVILVTGSGADDVNVQSTLAGGTTYVFTEGGDDVIVVSSDINAQGVLTGLAGPVSVDAGPGTNQLWVSELASTTGDVVNMANGIIVGSVVPFAVSYKASGGSFGKGVILVTGSANDAVNVFGMTPGVPTDVFTEGGNDAITVYVNSSSGYAGLMVDGGAGSNALIVQDTSGGGTIQNVASSSSSGRVIVTYPGGVVSAISYVNFLSHPAVAAGAVQALFDPYAGDKLILGGSDVLEEDPESP